MRSESSRALCNSRKALRSRKSDWVAWFCPASFWPGEGIIARLKLVEDTTLATFCSAWNTKLAEMSNRGGKKLSCGAALFTADEWFHDAVDNLFGDGDVQDVFAARHVIHDVEHETLEEASQGASAGAFLHGLRGQFAQSIGRKL